MKKVNAKMLEAEKTEKYQVFKFGKAVLDIQESGVTTKERASW